MWLDRNSNILLVFYFLSWVWIYNVHCVIFLLYIWASNCSSVGKESAYNAGYPSSIPGSGRSPGEGNGNLLQYSCLENPMDCSLPGSSVHGVTRVRHDLVTKPPPPHIYTHTHTYIHINNKGNNNNDLVDWREKVMGSFFSYWRSIAMIVDVRQGKRIRRKKVLGEMKQVVLALGKCWTI